MKKYKDIEIELKGYLAHVEIQRPPNNFFDYLLIEQIADAYEELDEIYRIDNKYGRDSNVTNIK